MFEIVWQRGEGWMDESRSEATFQLAIEDFTQFKEKKEWKESPQACIVRNLPWKILVKPEQTDNSDLVFAFLLGCNTEGKSTNWSIRAVAELRLVHQTDPEKNFIKIIEHVFCFKKNGRGSFLIMKDILDPNKGFFCRRLF